MHTGISIVIACYNSSAVIEETLSFVQNQIVDNSIQWEVILIDNKCTDDTTVKAKSIWDFNKNPNFRIIREEKAGLSNARMRGYLEAKYDIISFVDDDNLIPTNWVEYQNTIFKNKEIGILGCTSIGKFESEPPEWYEEHKLSFATGKIAEPDFSDITEDGIVYGAGMTLRKEIYTNLYKKNWQPYLSGRIGNKQTGGEDTELCYAARLLGYKIYYSNQINTLHNILPSRITWERLEKMTYGFGESDVFTLAYKMTYKEQQGKVGFQDNLRKKWWVNYLGKKIMLLLKDPFPNSKNKDAKKLLRLRNQGFCQYLLENKQKFEESFVEVKKLIS